MLYNNFIMFIGSIIVFMITSVMFVDESTLPINKFFEKEDASYFFIIYCNFEAAYETIMSDPSLLVQIIGYCLAGVFG